MTWWLVQHLVTVLVVVALIRVATWLFRAGPVIRHALWTIVLVKLIVPPVLAWPWQVPLQTATRAAGPQLEIHSTADIAVQQAAAMGARAPSAVAARQITPRAQPLSFNWRAVTMAAWAAGGCLFGLIHLIRVQRLRRVLRGAADPPAGLGMEAATIARNLRMSPIRIRMAPVSSPFIVGLFKPILVWPETLPAGIEPAVVPSLLAHELAHVARGDCWIGWIELVAGCIWWWNPLFWHVRSQVRANAELACDAWVGYLTPRARRAYAEALLAVSARPALPAPMPAIGMRSTNRRLMERRVALIMRAHVPVRLSHTALMTAAFVAVVVLPAWAQQTVPVPPPAPPAAVTLPVQEPPPFERPSPYAGSGVVIRRGAQVGSAGTFTRQVVPAQGQPGDVFYFSNNDKLPEGAQALMDAFDQSSGQTRRDAEEKIARDRTVLIEQLQKIQDVETKAGHLDEAVAIRARIRQLQNPAYAGLLAYRLSPGRAVEGQAGDTVFQVVAPGTAMPMRGRQPVPSAPPAGTR